MEDLKYGDGDVDGGDGEVAWLNGDGGGLGLEVWWWDGEGG